jgi:hypothetical protein
MSTGIRLRTDRVTFEQWIQATPGAALPTELTSETTNGAGRRSTGGKSPGDGSPGESHLVEIPPVVAASLAVHGCAEAAITVRMWAPSGGCFGCFGIVGDLAGSVVQSGTELEIGLFEVGAVVDEVVRLIPARPPSGWATVGEGPAMAGLEAVENVGVQITVLTADAAVAAWQRTLVGGVRGWREPSYPPRPGDLADLADLAGRPGVADTTDLTGTPGVADAVDLGGVAVPEIARALRDLGDSGDLGDPDLADRIEQGLWERETVGDAVQDLAVDLRLALIDCLKAAAGNADD